MGYTKAAQMVELIKELLRDGIVRQNGRIMISIADVSASMWRLFTGALARRCYPTAPKEYGEDDEDDEMDEPTTTEPALDFIDDVFLESLVRYVLEKIQLFCPFEEKDIISFICDGKSAAFDKINRVPKTVCSQAAMEAIKLINPLSIADVRRFVVLDSDSLVAMLVDKHPTLHFYLFECCNVVKRSELAKLLNVDESLAWEKLLRPFGFVNEEKFKTINADDNWSLDLLAHIISPEAKVFKNGKTRTIEAAIWGRLHNDSRFRYFIMDKFQAMLAQKTIMKQMPVISVVHGFKKEYEIHGNAIRKLNPTEIDEADRNIASFIKRHFTSNADFVIFSPDTDTLRYIFELLDENVNTRIFWVRNINKNEVYDLAGSELTMEYRRTLCVAGMLLGNDFIYTPVGGNAVDVLAKLQRAVVATSRTMSELLSSEHLFVPFIKHFMESNVSSRKGKRMRNGEPVPFSTPEYIFAILNYMK